MYDSNSFTPNQQGSHYTDMDLGLYSNDGLLEDYLDEPLEGPGRYAFCLDVNRIGHLFLFISLLLMVYLRLHLLSVSIIFLPTNISSSFSSFSRPCSELKASGGRGRKRLVQRRDAQEQHDLHMQQSSGFHNNNNNASVRRTLIYFVPMKRSINQSFARLLACTPTLTHITLSMSP